MFVYADTKIYVLSPSGRRSETADYCHALCVQINRLGLEGYMVYLPGGSGDILVDDYYLKYDLPYDTGVEDDERNILIVPEVAATFLPFVKVARRILWWVDVDNFFRDMGARVVRQFGRILEEPVPKFFTFSRSEVDVEHWAHSEYARAFLRVNGVSDDRISAVGDSLGKNILTAAEKVDVTAKKNIVAYRPVAGRDFTDIIRNLVTGADWRAVDGVNAEAERILAEAKVYVDFGDHGSRDRLTRVAAIFGCVVVTGKRGAAGNAVDFNIPADFKFDETVDAAVAAAEKIDDSLRDFDTELARQGDFREKILRESGSFAAEVAEALEVDVPRKAAVGIVHGLDGVGVELAELLFRKDVGLEPVYMVDDEDERGYVDLSDGRRLAVISSAAANFLYDMGSIDKFLRVSDTAAEIEFIREKLAPLEGDVIGLDFSGEG